MESDLDFYSEPDIHDHGSDKPESSLPDDSTIEGAINLLNETLSELINLNTALTHQGQENRQFLQEIGVELLNHKTVLIDLHNQKQEVKDKLTQIGRLIEELPDPKATLAEPLKQIQESQRILIKQSRRQATETPAPGAISFSRQAIAMLLAAQGVLVALTTVFIIHFVPPRATAKAEQQWYSIFQRVDKLYKAKFGNTPTK